MNPITIPFLLSLDSAHDGPIFGKVFGNMTDYNVWADEQEDDVAVYFLGYDPASMNVVVYYRNR